MSIRKNEKVILTIEQILELAKKGGATRRGILHALNMVYDAKEFAGSITHRHYISNLVATWMAFYYDNFNERIDLSKTRIPKSRGAFTRTIIMPGRDGWSTNSIIRILEQENLSRNDIIRILAQKRLSTQDIITTFAKIIPTKLPAHTFTYDVVARPLTSYAIRVKNQKTIDRTLAGKSIKQLEAMSINPITLTEYLIFILKFMHETGEILDTETKTICAGTRFENDTVPVVFYDKEEKIIKISWQKERAKDINTGPREIIL